MPCEKALSATLVAALVAVLIGSKGIAQARELSDTEIRKAIIQQSIAEYPGPCPCPYNTMGNGRACGGRSAYSRPGGYSPICYERDVTPDMIARFKR